MNTLLETLSISVDRDDRLQTIFELVKNSTLNDTDFTLMPMSGWMVIFNAEFGTVNNALLSADVDVFIDKLIQCASIIFTVLDILPGCDLNKVFPRIHETKENNCG